ncbi:hypothetical protein G3I40_03850 [Streptomyces sp. SID14478]|uniref:hypothetical protein n=1 Tax=Streptomyces sp. SID14478 TaxID=2706073 RepID=UPI0013DBFD3D|nr:hypothetical protein [Streptomyces sp. SID14478]NEB74370.1 hypothetical protein [Streptomyces sp. SID14478]
MKKKLLCTGGVLAVLVGGLSVGCSSDALKRCVPEKSAQISSTDLEGSYRGSGDADGAHIRLKSSPGEFGGTMTVRDWPGSDFPRYGKDKKFDGSGTWQVDRTADSGKYPMVRLSFEDPDALTTVSTVDMLSIGVDAKRSVLYDEADPDTCPAFRLQRN